MGSHQFSNYSQETRVNSYEYNNGGMELGERETSPIPISVPMAVRIHKGCKAYTKGRPVLHNLSMNVPQGAIYSLLGASGGGKTTILNCIAAQSRLDSGLVTVFGCQPGSKDSGIPGKGLGYMPQDIALYPYLTIKESLEFFGRIYGMSGKDIQTQADFLLEFLQLPEESRVIGTLSGGQQRRSSLAVSLIHNPPLLILDEPTVGLDPTLRESIWAHLDQLVGTRGTTVIITTHYIEEARYSHTVGFLRSGRLLLEKQPELLLEEHGAALLEEVVLKLCRTDNNELREVRDVEMSTPVTSGLIGEQEWAKYCLVDRRKDLPVEKDPPTFIQGLGNALRRNGSRIWALLLRNYLIYFRNIILLFGILCLPASQMFLNGLVVQEPSNMKFGVINKEFTNWTDYCFMGESKKECGTQQSCKFLRLLENPVKKKNFFKLISFPNEASALAQVKRGKIWGYLSIPGNYSDHLFLRRAHGLYPDNETLDNSIISMRMDNSQAVAGAFLRQNLFNSFRNFMRQSVEACGTSGNTVDLPFEYNPVYGASLEPRDLDYVVPGLLILIIYMVALCSCTIGIIVDEQLGTLDRSQVAGIHTLEIMISYFIAEGTFAVIEASLGAGILIYGFNLTMQGSPLTFLFCCIVAGLCGQATGFLIGLFMETVAEAFFSALFIYAPMMLLAGAIWPLEAMPKVVQTFSRGLPVTMLCESTRSVSSRGLGISHPLVYNGIGVCALWTLTFWLLSLVAFKFVKRK